MSQDNGREWENVVCVHPADCGITCRHECEYSATMILRTS